MGKKLSHQEYSKIAKFGRELANCPGPEVGIPARIGPILTHFLAQILVVRVNYFQK